MQPAEPSFASSGECSDNPVQPSALLGSNSEHGASISTVNVVALDPRMTDESVYFLFRQYGPIFHCEVARDVKTGASKCVAVVGFVHAADARNCVVGMHGRSVLVHDAVDGAALPSLDANGSVLPAHTVLQVHLAGPIDLPASSRRGGSSVSSKLFVRRVPLFATNASLAQYFEQFGHVTECALHRDVSVRCQVEGGLWNLAYVTFARAEDAYRVSRLEHADILLGPHGEFHHGPLFVKVAKAIDSNRPSGKLGAAGRGEVPPPATAHAASSWLASGAFLRHHYHPQPPQQNRATPAPFAQATPALPAPASTVPSEPPSNPQAHVWVNFTPDATASYSSSTWGHFQATTEGRDPLAQTWTTVQHAELVGVPSSVPFEAPVSWLSNASYPPLPHLAQHSVFIPTPATVPLMFVPAPAGVVATSPGDPQTRHSGLGAPSLAWQPSAALHSHSPLPPTMPFLRPVTLPDGQDSNVHTPINGYFPR